MGFNYRKRDPAALEKRLADSGDFISFIANGFTIFSPKKGENWVRILPPTWDDAEHYGLDVHVHYGIGPERASVLCNSKMFGTACPVCEAMARATKAGDEELAKELRPQKRVLVWVIDRNEPNKGAMIWSMSRTMDEEIVKISRDRETGETYAIDNPYEGYDLYFTRDGEGIKTKYTGYTLARRASSVKDELLEFITINPILAVLVERDYKAVKAIFEGPQPPADERRDSPAPEPRREADEPVPQARRRSPPPDDGPREQPRPTLREPTQPEDDEIPFTGGAKAAPSGDGMTEGQRRAAELRARLAKK